MKQALARRLSGIVIDAAPAAAVEALPRMDIAVLVGLSATGPLHQPVALDSVAQYAAVFGPDAMLAWDAEAGAPAQAHLGPAVRSFFANGGRRCWVIRVARCAEGEALRRGILLEQAHQLPDVARSNRFALPGLLAADRAGRLAPALAQARCEGSWSDRLRVACALTQRALVVEALQFDSPLSERCELRTRQPVQVGELVLLGDPDSICAYAVVQAVNIDPEAAAPWRCSLGLAAAFANALALLASPAVALSARVTVQGYFEDLAASLQAGSDARLQLQLQLQLPDAVLPPVGAWARVGVAGQTAWLRIDAAQRSDKALLEGPAWLALPLCWPPELTSVRSAQRLALDLRCEGFGPAQTVPALGLAPEHATSWWLQRTDAQHHRQHLSAPTTPRFPLAAIDGDDTVQRAFIPLGVPALFGARAAPLPDPHDALERDGLSLWDEQIFLDPQLAGVEEAALLASAEALRTRPAEPREKLLGLHALLDIGDGGLFNDASLLALPDATHSGWDRVMLAAPPQPDQIAAPAATGTDDHFTACAASAGPAAPAPVPPAPPVQRWQVPGTTKSDARRDAFDSRLLTLHRAVLRLAAATGEVFAVLGLPRHFRGADASRYAARLRSLRGERDAGADAIADARTLSHGALVHPWLIAAQGGRFEHAVLSVPTPPDGAMLGVLAARSARRGAWIAPANEPLSDVIALTPAIGDAEARLLQDAQVNLIRHDPRGLIALSADTLARPDEAELRPINVRRLLSLLRRLALRRGARWAFEPMGAVLRRAVQRSFDELMGELFRRGAFAGVTRAAAFRVITDQTLQSARDADAGRLVVELRVAPSLPMRFIGIRLVHSGERLSVVETL